ncbi:MAG: site-specific integrase, partial [Treponema sp.]|nr:site-specific integrase [Treponema sp.]
MLPFSIFLRGGRPCYYVAFKNEDTGKYLPAVSTKKIKKSDAERQAWVWYREGIPKRNGKSDIKTLSLHDSIRHIPLTTTDAELIVDELKRKGLVLSCILA